ncbi:P-loop ATPase, Sll1717 family [Cellulosimicrobium funkei]|uniref:P-loop ATPase, Sll1717 family n=1 Tax=Cellulosimicrobium funkei TaxID=264251 RepID=UPI0037A0CA47
MLIVDLLNSIHLGHDAAENDQALEAAFVETQAFRRLIGDDIDLVTGLKGTGKSALYRMLTEYPAMFPELDNVHIVRASNPTSNPVFKVLFTEQSSELRLRSIWAAFFAGLIGNTVVDQHLLTGGVSSRVQEINDVLELLGLRIKPKKEASLLQRILAAKSFEPTITSDTSGVFTFGLKFDVPDSLSTSNQISLELSDFMAVIKSCDDVMKSVGEKVWVAVDRLDECFTRDSEMERRALRALLRTHLDITSELGLKRRVGAKLFLRTDLLRRMSSDVAFTNSTHLRSIELQWNEKDIQNIVGRRLLQSSNARRAWPDCASSARPAEHAWRHLVPQRLTAGDGRPAVHDICAWTSDGHRATNPRNVLTLLRLSLQRLSEVELDRVPMRQVDPGQPLLEEPLIKSSLGKLSRKRLTDTVLNEFPGVEHLVRALERGPSSYGTRTDLLRKLGLESTTEAVQDGALDLLLLTGVLGRNGEQYVVPILYRAALRTVSTKALSARRRPVSNQETKGISGS